MDFLKRIPWWGYIVLVIAVFALFGKTHVSVGNVSVGGKDLGGYDSDKGRIPPKQ